MHSRTNYKIHVHDRSTTIGYHPSKYDILAQVMSMSRFRLAPKIGHLERMKRIYGYLLKTKHFTIRYHTKKPDYSHLPKQEYEWARTVYGNVIEEIPKDLPKQLGKRVITTALLDANLLHDIVTGKSVTAVLKLFNTTQQTCFQRDKLLWRLQHMVQSVLLPKLQQNKFWALEIY